MQKIKVSGRLPAQLPTQSFARQQALGKSQGLRQQSARPLSGDVFEAPSLRAFPQAGIARAQAPRQPAPGTDPFSNLVDEALMAAMRKAYHEGKSTLAYSDARQAIFSTIDNIDGIVECLYTGRRLQTRSAPKPENMNVEHILPQSNGAKGEARSDLNDIAAADYEANEKRGNLPYGNVVRATWEKGGTKVGFDKDGKECCEVRDLYKGNVARMMFAACVDYGIPLDDKQEAVLRDWAKRDPVDDGERARSQRTAMKQGKGNFFVDYPWLIDRIKNL
jgi:deoxyribonuclease-1